MNSIPEFIETIRKSPQHNWVYHFTDTVNFQSIIDAGGLYSKAELARRGITPTRPGGNQWSHGADSAKGLSDYVNLCLTRRHPMSWSAKQDGRLVDPRYLGITPEVLQIQGVKFSLDIANKKDVEVLNLDGNLHRLDLQVIYQKMNWKDPEISARLKAAEKYEILVPNYIPLEMIKVKF